MTAVTIGVILLTPVPSRAQSISTGDGTWIWQNPLPQGNTLNGVWGIDSGNVWTVGESGTIMKWNGSIWNAQSSGTTNSLSSVWGTDANNVWAAGYDGTIVKWNGSGWSPQNSGTTNWLFSIWGADANNVWAVGDNGTILKWNGSTWTTQTSGTTLTLYAVWGSDANNVWAVGSSGRILRWNGTTWTTQTSGTAQSLYSVWGSDVNNVWTVGSSGTILRWNGSVWAVQISNTTEWIGSVWGSSDTSIWAVGNGGMILKWNGSQWTAQSSHTVEWIASVWGSSDTSIWAVGNGGTILKWSGNTWSTQKNGTTQMIYVVWGIDSTNIWAAGAQGTILRWDGSGWNSQSSGTSYALVGIWGSNATNVWAVGDNGLLLNWNGDTWSTHAILGGGNFQSIWGVDSNNIWAVGDSGRILRWNGSAWVQQSSSTTDTLWSVWGLDINNIWAVGDNGAIVKWDGGNWSIQNSGTTVRLYGVWGSDVNNVWAVGSGGTILKWNGSVWIAQGSGTTSSLNGIWGTSDSNIWAAASAGAILKWNGSTWNVQDTGIGQSLASVWGSDAIHVWVTGGLGTILQAVAHQVMVKISGEGQVVSDPSGIDCGSDCSEGYLQNTPITLTASPSQSSIFGGWSGACSGNGQCNLTLNAEHQVTATFIACHTLFLSHSGSGDNPVASPSSSVGCSIEQYVEGQVINVSASPFTDWQIAGWSGTSQDSSTSINNSLIMPGASHSVVAVYQPICYPLSISYTGQGAIPAPMPPNSTGCTPGHYVTGESISFSASPSMGWQIAGWSGTSQDSSTSTNNSVLMPGSELSVSASYQPICFSLTLDHTGEGTTPVPSPSNSDGCLNGHYIIGEDISLFAAPIVGWRITSWSGTNQNSSTAATNNLSMPASNHSTSVAYQLDCYTLTLSHTGQGTNPVPTPANSIGCATGQFVNGEIVNLSAIPATGWHIGSWTGTGQDGNTTGTNGLTMPAGNRSASVAYQLDCYTLTLSHTGQGTNPVPTPANSIGCAIGQYVRGEVVSLSSNPATGWYVASWAGTNADGSTAIANNLTMPTSNHTASVAYQRICYTLTIAHAGQGSNPAPTPTNSTGCPTGTYVAGESINLIANPASGWSVRSWLGTTRDNSSTPSNSLIMPAGPHSISVTYQQDAGSEQPIQLFLSLAVNAPPLPLVTLQDGDFEARQGWLQSPAGLIIVPCHTLSGSQLKKGCGGAMVAWLGGSHSFNTHILSQVIQMTTAYPVSVRFRYFIESKRAGCDNGIAELWSNSNLMQTFPLCNPANSDWKQISVVLPSIEGVQDLRFVVKRPTGVISSFFVDDISLCSTSSYKHPGMPLCP